MSPLGRRSAARGSTSERGRPWLTLLLALACAGGFAAQLAVERHQERVLRGQLETAAEFLLERPYLEAPALLLEHVGAERLERVRSSFEASRVARAAPPIPPGVERRHQETLDGHMQRARDTLFELPAHRLGLGRAWPAPEALLGHAFVHAGWRHVIGSLALLAVLGVALEASLGAAFLGWVAVLSAAGAGVAHAQLGTGEGFYVGMTGLLAGLFGAFLVCRSALHEDSQTGLASVLALGVLVLPAAIGLELALARPEGVQPAEPGAWNVSNWALLGGLGAGIAAAWAARLLGLEGAGAASRGGRSPRLVRALKHRDAGSPERAFRALEQLLRREPEEHEAALAFWDVAFSIGRAQAAAPALLRAIRAQVEGGQLDSAVGHWLELVACDLDGTAEPGQQIRMAALLRDAGEPVAALRALRSALDRAASSAAATRIAREASSIDADTAEEAAWRALGSLDLDFRERQSLESLIGELQPSQAGRLSSASERPRFAPEPPPRDVARPAPAAGGPGAIDFEEKSRPLEAAAAVPMGFDDDGLHLQLEGSQRRLRFDRIEAVSVASVEGLGDQPVILVDLVLNWMSLSAEPLRLVRLRTDHFDPRRLMARGDALDAVRSLVELLLDETGATPLPDLQSARGLPFAAFPSLVAYQRDVLAVDAETDVL